LKRETYTSKCTRQKENVNFAFPDHCNTAWQDRGSGRDFYGRFVED